jgi:hypothetical protein
MECDSEKGQYRAMIRFIADDSMIFRCQLFPDLFLNDTLHGDILEGNYNHNISSMSLVVDTLEKF